MEMKSKQAGGTARAGTPTQRRVRSVLNDNRRPDAGVAQLADNRAGAAVYQLATYASPHVTMKAGWKPDSDPWPGSKGPTGFWAGTNAVKGTSVNGGAAKLCDDVTALTTELGTTQNMGHPHMAPQRMGGKGDVNNVRPWSQSFENSQWHGTLDHQVKTEFKAIPAGHDFYEDVVTVEAHHTTNAWLQPLQDKHDHAAAGPDKVALAGYLAHLKGILNAVPDSAAIHTPGGVYAAAGSTFNPAPISMPKAKAGLLKFNGGQLDNLKPVATTSAMVTFFRALGISLAVGSLLTVAYLLKYGYPLHSEGK